MNHRPSNNQRDPQRDERMRGTGARERDRGEDWLSGSGEWQGQQRPYQVATDKASSTANNDFLTF